MCVCVCVCVCLCGSEAQEALHQLQRSHNGIDPSAAAAAASDDTEVRQMREELSVLHRVVAGEKATWSLFDLYR